MAESATNLPPARTPEALWQRIVQDYRQLCALQRQARAEESDRLLRDELPARILAWAEQDPSDGTAKARRLDQMFQREHQRLADAWMLEELLEQRLRSQVMPALTARIDAEVRRAMQAPAASRPELHISEPAPRPAPTVIPLAESCTRPARVSVGDIPSIIDLILHQERQSGARHLAA